MTRVARAVLLAAFAIARASAANGEETSGVMGRILVGLPQSARVTLIRHETGEKLTFGGRSSLYLKELAAGTWSIHQFGFRADRRRASPFPLHRYRFVVPTSGVGFVGDWDVHFASPYLAATGSGGAGGGGPHHEAVTCRCDSRLLERARERWPNELGASEILPLCAGYLPELGATRPLGTMCGFWIEAPQ